MLYFLFILFLLAIVFAFVWLGARAKRSADEPGGGRYPEPDDNLESKP